MVICLYTVMILDLIKDGKCVYCAVRVHSLNVFQDQLSFSKR
jgi:hypothetical protein